MSESIEIGTEELYGSLKGHTYRWNLEVCDDGGVLEMRLTWFDIVGNRRVHGEVFSDPKGNAITNLNAAMARGIELANRINRRMIAERNV